MVFCFSENDGSNIKKYEQQDGLMSTSVSRKINIYKTQQNKQAYG